MSISTPPTPASGDSEPGHPPSVPGVALWGDSDSPAAEKPPGVEFAGLLPKKAPTVLPTIGHIGRYALKYQLGEGGLGTVYAAHDPLLSRLIAVKTLNVEVTEDRREAFNKLFINEARAAGGLSHPHIVTVFDAGISDKRAYIAMELLKGRDLRQLRQEGWRATPAQAALIVRRVADALAFAHSKGVIHRDIKPANIIMVGRTQPRVLDFGIARVAHQNERGDPNAGAGSPYYMAPEQILRGPADRRVDVFSLGVVLYELLTDGKPFRGESLKEIRQAVLTFDPPLASKVDPGVPLALAEIAARAMAKDPERRFRSARSFARDLRQWLDANPVVSDGNTIPAPVQAPRSRRRAVWGAALVGLAGLGTAAVWLAVDLLPSRSAADTVQATAVAALPVVVASPAPATVTAPALVAAEPVQAPAGEPAVDAFDAGASATAARTVALSTPEAIMSASLGLINAPNTAPAVTPKIAPTEDRVVVAEAPLTQRDAVKERRAREAKEREARERELRAAVRAPLPAAPATGTVRIAISPWGLVEVDGAPSGAAPPLTELTLAEGRHQIVVRNGDFPPYVASVNVVAGQPVTLRHKFGS